MPRDPLSQLLESTLHGERLYSERLYSVPETGTSRADDLLVWVEPLADSLARMCDSMEFECARQSEYECQCEEEQGRTAEIEFEGKR